MNCQQCGIKTNNPKFCSNSCAAKYNNVLYPKRKRKELFFCLYCGKEQPPNNNKYCNNTCQNNHAYKKYIERWLNGIESGISGTYETSRYIKRYLLEKSNHKCSQCGWDQVNPYTKKCPLEIDHIDGDYKNNKETNLRILCPNCHSLTKNYKGANKGHGRTARHKYYHPTS